MGKDFSARRVQRLSVVAPLWFCFNRDIAE